MTIAVTKVGGWSTGEVYTAAQATAQDANVTNAADKRTGQTDNIAARWKFTDADAGRIVESRLTPANADTTYTLAQGISFIDGDAVTLTAARTYTLSATGAISNDVVKVRGNRLWSILVKDGVSGNVLATLIPQAGTEKALGEFFFDGTNWQIRRVTGNRNLSQFSNWFPEYWTGTINPFVQNALPATIAGDQATFDSNSRYTRKDVAASLAALSASSYPGLIELPNFTTLNYGRAWAQILGPAQLIDGKTLSSVTLERLYTLASAGSITRWFRFWISRSLMPGAANSTPPAYDYLSSAGFALSTTELQTYNGTHLATMTCNQNNVIDLSKYVYQLHMVFGPTDYGYSHFKGATFNHS